MYVRREYFSSVIDRRQNHIYLYCSIFCVKRSHLASRPSGSVCARRLTRSACWMGDDGRKEEREVTYKRTAMSLQNYLVCQVHLRRSDITSRTGIDQKTGETYSHLERAEQRVLACSFRVSFRFFCSSVRVHIGASNVCIVTYFLEGRIPVRSRLTVCGDNVV